MASLQCTSGGTYHVYFYYLGELYHRSLGTKDAEEARDLKNTVEKKLRRLERGDDSLQGDVTPTALWQFLRSDARPSAPAKVTKSVRFDNVGQQYVGSFPTTSKEDSTLVTERKHLRNLQRLIGKATRFDQIKAPQIREYIRQRQLEAGQHGKTVQPETIRKELQTLKQVWDFAKTENLVTGDNPLSQVNKPRRSEKMPFMTREQIEQRIERGGLTEGDIAELWECLFLREQEVSDFLAHVHSVVGNFPRCPYIYPALAFCAYTGARRSEMFRCLIDDVSGGNVLLREKKKSQDKQFTFRQIPLHAELEQVLEDWLAVHPGGQYLFCKNNTNPLEDKTARDALTSVKRRSRWSVVRGFHVLRHSFCSNLARHGVDQYKIDQLMGHQTEEQRRRYKHLFPEDRKRAVDVLSFGKRPSSRFRVVG